MEGKISNDEIIEAISSSGYLIEQRIEPVLSKMGYVAEINDVYFDEDTGKTREIDLTALKGELIYENLEHFIFPYILIECENNAQPTVFFKKKESPIDFLFHEAVKMSGIPARIFPIDEHNSIRLNEFLKFDEFHHYCDGNFSTQYCSFQQVNRGKISKWIALHPDAQHNSFQNMIKCLKYKIAEHYYSYKPAQLEQDEYMNIQVFYPLIILQGDLIEASIEKGELRLKPQNHIQFRKQIVKSDTQESFQIDIIRESYLKSYLKIVDKEIGEIIKRLKRKRAILEKSIEILINKINHEPDVKKHPQILDF